MKIPPGEKEYCIYIKIREQASNDIISLDGICENMNVEDLTSSQGSYFHVDARWNPSTDHHLNGIFDLNFNVFVEEDYVNTVIMNYEIFIQSSSNDFKVFESFPSTPNPMFKTTFSIFGPMYKFFNPNCVFKAG